MKTAHLIFGGLVIVAFLLTGQYMDKYYQHMEGVADGLRMLYRTRHIFILLAGLLNLGIGAYFTTSTETLQKALQLLGSALVMVASLLFIAAFFYEPTLEKLRTPLSHWGAYTIVAGTLLHLLSGLRQKREIITS
ncbi:MAG TPA: hypothetical protein VF723_07900 [Pyrinomonadaceae bacterium]